MHIFLFSFNKRTHTYTEKKTDIHMNTVRREGTKRRKKKGGEINSLHVLGYAYNQHICSKKEKIIVING